MTFVKMKPIIKKTIQETFYGYQSNGSYTPTRLESTKIAEYDYKGQLISKVYKEFDNEGKLVREESTRRRFEDNVVIYEKYNAQNKLLSYKKYDGSGNMIELHTRADQTFCWEYDEDGKLIQERIFDSNGELSSEDKSEYNKNGDLVKSVISTRYDENLNRIDHLVPWECNYHYSRDIMGDIVRTVSSGDDYVYIESDIKNKDTGLYFENKGEFFEDKFVTALRYYDKRGEQICRSHWHTDDLIKTTQISYYKYDEYGNWIMHVQPFLVLRDIGDGDCLICIREIEYLNTNDNPF